MRCLVKWAALLLMLLGSVAHADSHRLSASTNNALQPSGDRSAVGQMPAVSTKPDGYLFLGKGVQVPAYAVALINPADDSDSAWLWFQASAQERHVPANISTPIAAQLVAYYHSWGWILVPQEYRLVKAAMGANGSESLLFTAPDGRGYVSYFNTSACIGCAQSAASAFFPEAKRDAIKNEFGTQQTDVPIKKLRLRPHLMAYQAIKQGQRLDGLVYYNADSDLPFIRLK